MAVIDGMADRTPNARASQLAVATTPRLARNGKSTLVPLCPFRLQLRQRPF